LPPVTRLLLLAAVVAAMAMAQPSVVFGLIAASLPVAVSAMTARFRRTPRAAGRLAIIAISLGAMIALAAAWRLAGAIGYTAPWGPEGDWAEGILDVLLYTIDDGAPALGL